MTAHERASSRGASPRPKRARDCLAPRAWVNAVPSARKVSSVVWWSSTIQLAYTLCIQLIISKTKGREEEYCINLPWL